MTEEDIHLLLWDSLQDLLSGTSQGANECSAPLFGEKKKKRGGCKPSTSKFLQAYINRYMST